MTTRKDSEVVALRKSARTGMMKQLFGRPLAGISLVLIVAFVMCAVFAPLLAPADPNAGEVLERLKPPLSPDHLLGTDEIGRDLLSRLIYGAQLSLLVAFTGTVLSGMIGIALGAIAGYYRGWLEAVIMRCVDVMLAFPAMVLFIAVLAFVGAGVGNLIFVLVITQWVEYARVVHGSVLSAREANYVYAARSMGLRESTILWRQVLPNVIAPVIVIGSFSMGIMIILEATLSFLGLGVPPSIPTWGGILASGREYIVQAWWLSTLPGVAILLTVLSFNVIGDSLRDWLDPTTRGQVNL